MSRDFGGLRSHSTKRQLTDRACRADIPFPRLLKDPSLALASSDADQPPPDRITFICRRGNDSLLASRALRRYLEAHDPPKANTIEVDDVVGGLSAWARQGEEGFPIY